MKNIELVLVIGFSLALAATENLQAYDVEVPTPGQHAYSSPPPPDPMEQVNAAIAHDPTDPVNFILRCNIYGQKKDWGDAKENYEKALALDPQNSSAKVDLAEIQFRQKQYDQARASFVPLESDKDFGDLASYMIFLCDLFGKHEDAAAKELAVFNAAGEKPSYYFGNIAWDVVHHNTAGARDFMNSAEAIYQPLKADLYTINLVELGYLPLKQ